MRIMCKYILGIGLTLLMTTGAFAGYVQPALVEVDLENNFAGGDMVSARAAKEDVSIGCGVRNYEFEDGNTYAWGFCQATDAEGERAFCRTESPHLLDAIKSIADNSYINFSYNVEMDEEGNEFFTCELIGNSTQSFYMPKVKANKVKKDDDDDDD